MLIDPTRSILLVVDIQEKLLPAVHEPEGVLRNASRLLGAANRLQVPVLATEQNPDGLGRTVDKLRNEIVDTAIYSKTAFNALADESIRDSLAATGMDQVIVAGLEAHVCVLQSALELAANEIPVFMVADATSSRTPENHARGIERAQTSGVQVVTTEMVLFEWLGSSEADAFKDIFALIK